MGEAPNRPIVHLEPTRRQLGHKAPQGEIARRHPLAKPSFMRASNKPRPMTAHLARRDTARRPEPLRPLHDTRRADAQRRAYRTHALARLNTGKRPLTQIH